MTTAIERARRLNRDQSLPSEYWSSHGPRALRFGVGVGDRLGEVLVELSIRRVALITSPGMLRRRRALEIVATVEAFGIPVERVEVSPDPNPEVVRRVCARLTDKPVEGVVAIGGGSAMDSAKLVALLLGNGRPGQRDLSRLDWVRRPGLPIILLPSTAGSGSEATHEVVLSDSIARTKYALKHPYLTADVALVDPSLHTSCTHELTVASGADALIHALEAFANRRATPLSDLYALRAFELLFRRLPEVVEDPRAVTLRADMALGSHVAGLAFAGTGTAAIHACGYPLTADYGIPHGVANALMAASVVHHCADASPRYRSLASVIGARALAPALVDLMSEIGMPSTLEAAGVERASLPHLACRAAMDRRHLSVNPQDLDERALLHVYERAWSGL